MEHSFNVNFAKDYGIEEAIIINNVYFWIRHNVSNGSNKNDGRYWTFNSAKAFSELFPYMGEKKIARVLTTLINNGVLLKGRFSDDKMIRTNWYSFSDDFLCLLEEEKYDVKGFSDTFSAHFSKMGNAFTENGECIYIDNNNNSVKEDNKQEDKKKENKEKEEEFIEEMYKLYPTKCPVRGISLGKSSKDKDRIRRLLKQYSMEDIENVIRHEIEEKYNKHYMQNFSTFLNNFPDPQIIKDVHSPNSASVKKSENMVINGQIYR